MSLEEYEVALMYTIMKMEHLNTTSKEGVEILQNIPFEDALLGKGQYTSKIYHLQSKIPGWLKTVAPTSALTVQEESWNSHPKSKTVIKCPYFAQCSLTIETVSKADNGCSENVHGLSNELLAARKVEFIDIASVSRDYWSKAIGTANVDLSTFKSQRTGYVSSSHDNIQISDRGSSYLGFWQSFGRTYPSGLNHPVERSYRISPGPISIA
ncbi:hypothetical protein COCNU_04G014440 [Cocos nucifera]|uniref:Phosphatidylinositol transfer protein N-terminal domain-containing protein n=1 Tax=Cocos nucifera TaxID=13894 RepID=A0A8K0N0V5_COCNU|nr:hypothetical protein COCNU_04G014440 [Cocos nucifera]